MRIDFVNGRMSNIIVIGVWYDILMIRMSKSRRMTWALQVARMGKKNAYRILIGKPEGKRPLGRPRCWWVDRIKMDLREIGWVDIDRIGLAQDRDRWRSLVNTVMKRRVL
jgi:hypothetical protein